MNAPGPVEDRLPACPAWRSAGVQGLDGATIAGIIWLVPLPFLATAGLSLRPVTEDDLSMMVDLNSDPAVMAHILGRPASPAETAAEWSARLSQRTDVARGLGYWAGYHAEQFVGWWAASGPSVN